MKEIVLIGSRSSAGKESLLAAFLAISKGNVIADCSLEFNALIKVMDIKDVRERRLPFFRGFFFDQERCTHCGMCLGVCMQHALRADEQQMTFYDYRCTHCGSCIKWCPMMALSHEEESDVSLCYASSRFGPLVFSNVFMEPSLQPVMIRAIRENARRLARDSGAGMVLINGPRGLRNTTMAAIENADTLVAIVSPAPHAVEDLGRLIRFSRKSGIDPLVILNMTDIDPQQSDAMQTLCHEMKVIVAGTVRFSHEFRNSLSCNRAITETNPLCDVSLSIRGIWETIQQHAQLNF